MMVGVPNTAQSTKDLTKIENCTQSCEGCMSVGVKVNLCNLLTNTSHYTW